MSSLTVQQLREQLRRREIAPVYVLSGQETYLRDIAAKTIANRSFDEGDFRDFNDNEFSLAESDSLRSALSAAEQLPMMSKRRVVRITDVRVAVSSNKDTLKEEHEGALKQYLERPSDSTVLIILADELNAVRRMTKLLKQHAITVEFMPLGDNELVAWAREKALEEGCRIDERTLQLLVSRVGPDVRRLTTEIGKLATASLPEKAIDAELVESLVPNVRVITNFELTDHLIAGRRDRAIAVLRKILDDGAEPLGLLGLIASNYRRLLAAKDLMESGADRARVISMAKLHPRDAEKFLGAARRADIRRLTHAIRRLASTDVAIKTSVGGSGQQGARMQLEVLVCELAAS